MKKLSGIMVFVLLSLVSNTMLAANVAFVDGQDYIKFTAESRNNPDVAQLLIKDPNKIQVLYFFNYGCPACARFDPNFNKWAAGEKADNKLVIYKFPVAFKDEWEELAKLYYVMKTLDPKENLSTKIFKAIQEQNQQLWQTDKMKEYFVQNGYTAETFDKTYNSFSVNREVENAQQLSIAYAINRTPTIVVNGPKDSYKINLDSRGKNFFKVLDYVIALESKNIQK